MTKKTQDAILTLPHVFATVPRVRQSLYGVDKGPLVPQDLQNALLRQAVVREIPRNPKSLLRFYQDIKQYSFQKPIPLSLLQSLEEQDIPILPTSSFVFIDLIGDHVLYLVRYKRRHYLCWYAFQRYTDMDNHPNQRLLYAVAIQPQS